MFVAIKGAIQRHFLLIKKNGLKELLKVSLRFSGFILGMLPALILLLIIRLISPWILIRIYHIWSPRIGHFAVNTELYVCAMRDGLTKPQRKYFDICFHGGIHKSNLQLAKMWDRTIRVWPKWLMEPVYFLNKLMPGGKQHLVDGFFNSGRDIYNLLEKYNPSLTFTIAEERRGEQILRSWGLEKDAKFVCLIVRDRAYLDKVLPYQDYGYHDYRDSDIHNYVLAAEFLTQMGYYVFRMGQVVNAHLKTDNPRIFDYATNGMRDDFMDIYLGAKCSFCISTGTGYDGVPAIFRRPILFVNFLPLGYLETSRPDSICLTKGHYLSREKRYLSVREIFALNLGFSPYSDTYQEAGVTLTENTPKEIRDAAEEMISRLNATWQLQPQDEEMQKKFWETYPVNARGAFMDLPLHGKIRTRYSAKFLQANPWWLN